MKLLFTVPHFYKPLDGIEYSASSSSAQSRIDALNKLILALHQQFGSLQYALNYETGKPFQILEAPRHEIAIKICTTGDCHLLNQLSIPKNLYTHSPTSAEDLMLGFECHRILQGDLGQYDYYCFMEDDLIIQDSYFFEKLKAFNRLFGPENLLQPNRYEVSAGPPFIKVRLDGAIPMTASQPFQDISQQRTLQLPFAGSLIKFQRAVNPHAGCFFLTHEQMQYWVRQPYFLDKDVSFVGRHEGPTNAATLGIMKTFRVYKPVADSMNFLEIQHAAPRLVQRIQ